VLATVLWLPLRAGLSVGVFLHRALRTEYETDVDLLRLASDLVIDAIVEPEDLRHQLVTRLAAAAGRDRTFSARRHGVPPV